MPRLRVKVVIERMYAMQEWNNDLIGSVVNFDTGERLPDFMSFKLVAVVGGQAVGVSGPLPYLTEMRGEVTYHDPSDSGKMITQYVEVTEMTVRTVKP
jgi:hypothetical protein